MTQGINMLGFSCYPRSVYKRDVENHHDSGEELVVGLFLCLEHSTPSYDLPFSSPVLLVFTPFPRLCVFLWLYPSTNKA